MKFNVVAVLWICFYWASSSGYSQSLYKQEILQKRKAKSREVYRGLANNSPLFTNAKAYGYFYPQAEGKHFLSGTIGDGTMMYDGILYHALSLHYDMYNDLIFVVYEEGGGNKYLIINDQKISTCTFGDRQYINLTSRSIPLLKSGIYEQAFWGNENKLLVKRRVELIRDASQYPGSKRLKFVRQDVYYLLRGNEVFIIKGKKSFLRALQNSSEAKSFIKREKLKFRYKKLNFTNSIVKVLQMVDQ